MPTVPQNILLSWTKTGGYMDNIQYRPKIIEILPGDKDLEQAMRSKTHPVLFEKEVNGTFYVLGANDPALVSGKPYAFSVTAFDPDGKAKFKNNGTSQVSELFLADTSQNFYNNKNLCVIWRCPHCKYEWRSSSLLDTDKCPNCGEHMYLHSAFVAYCCSNPTCPGHKEENQKCDCNYFCRTKVQIWTDAEGEFFTVDGYGEVGNTPNVNAKDEVHADCDFPYLSRQKELLVDDFGCVGYGSVTIKIAPSTIDESPCTAGPSKKGFYNQTVIKEIVGGLKITGFIHICDCHCAVYDVDVQITVLVDIDEIVDKKAQANSGGYWFDGQNVPLNGNLRGIDLYGDCTGRQAKSYTNTFTYNKTVPVNDCETNQAFEAHLRFPSANNNNKNNQGTCGTSTAGQVNLRDQMRTSIKILSWRCHQ